MNSPKDPFKKILKDKQNLSIFVLLVDTECDKCDGNKSRVFSFGEKNHSFELKELYSTTSGDNELLQYVGSHLDDGM